MHEQFFLAAHHSEVENDTGDDLDVIQRKRTSRLIFSVALRYSYAR